MTTTSHRIWEWLPGRTDSRRVTLPATIAAALDLPLAVVTAELRDMERHGYAVRDAAVGISSGWHRGKHYPATPEARTDPEWTLY